MGAGYDAAADARKPDGRRHRGQPCGLALSDELCLSEKTVEAHVRSIFAKLDLAPDPGDHRRVLAVLAFLRS